MGLRGWEGVGLSMTSAVVAPYSCKTVVGVAASIASSTLTLLTLAFLGGFLLLPQALLLAFWFRVCVPLCRGTSAVTVVHATRSAMSYWVDRSAL